MIAKKGESLDSAGLTIHPRPSCSTVPDFDTSITFKEIGRVWVRVFRLFPICITIPNKSSSPSVCLIQILSELEHVNLE